jgi:hypothetical protein
MSGAKPSVRRTLSLLVVVGGLPCLLCTGMAMAVFGQGFGSIILGWILLVYFLIGCYWLVTWLILGPPKAVPRSDENHSEPSRYAPSYSWHHDYNGSRNGCYAVLRIILAVEAL